MRYHIIVFFFQVLHIPVLMQLNTNIIKCCTACWGINYQPEIIKKRPSLKIPTPQNPNKLRNFSRINSFLKFHHLLVLFSKNRYFSSENGIQEQNYYQLPHFKVNILQRPCSLSTKNTITLLLKVYFVWPLNMALFKDLKMHQLGFQMHIVGFWGWVIVVHGW